MRPVTPLLFAAVLALPCPARAQAADVAPRDNLVTKGIPQIPAAIAEEARRYSEFRTAAFWDWHPTRREMLIGTRFEDAHQLHVVRFPGGARTQLTFFPDPVSGASYQPTRGEYMVFSKDVGGAEFFQKYRYDVATGEVTLLTDGKSRNVGGAWSHAGDRYAYMSTRRDGRDLDLWVINPAEPRRDRMVAQLEGGGHAPVDWSPDDRTILLGQGVSVNDSYVWLVDVTTGEKTLLAPPAGGERVAYADTKFSRDGKGIYLSTDEGSAFKRLAYLDLATKRTRYLTSHIPWDVEEFELSADGKLVAFVVNEDGVGGLRVMRTATGTEVERPKLPVGLISGLRWRGKTHDLGFTFSTARSNGDAYSLDRATGTLTRCTESETGVRREDAYKDIGALFDWIRTRPDLDAERVLVTGGSYGGHMTLVTATRYDERICCSVDVVGISNLATFLQNTSGYRQDLRRVEYGDERDSTTRAWMERSAPLNNADRVTKPLFVVQGMSDPRVPRSEAEQMVAALERRNVPVWYLMARDEGHGFQKKANVDFQFYATILFVKKYLVGQ